MLPNHCFVAHDAASGKVLWSRLLRDVYQQGRPLAINQSPPMPTSHGLLVSDWQKPQFLLDFHTGEPMAQLAGNVGYYAAKFIQEEGGAEIVASAATRSI